MKRFTSITLVLLLMLMPILGIAQKTKQSQVSANTIKMIGALGNRCVQTSSSGVLTEVPCWVSPPSSPTDLCSPGQAAYDALYYYVCTGTNQWQRVALSPDWGTVTVNVKTYGAVGDGVADDTSEINAAIAALQAGYTLYFPCGTYLVSAALTTISLDQVTVAGAPGCATIKTTTALTQPILRIGAQSPLSASSTLSAQANELSNTFGATFSTLGGLSVNDLVYLEEGGRDYSTDGDTNDPNGGGSAPNDLACDVSGCRGEVLQIQSVGSNTATVTTTLHNTYIPSTNGAKVYKITTVAEQINVHDLTFDGSNVAVTGLEFRGAANSTAANLVVKNFTNEGFGSQYTFNVAFNNVTVDHCGIAGMASALFYHTGRNSANGITIQNLAESSAIKFSTTVDGTFSNIYYDGSTGVGSGGRPVKTLAARYNTFTDMVIKNTQSNPNGYYGIALEYYSSNNTFNRLTMSGIGGGMVAGFGNYNQNNKFINSNLTAYNNYPIHHAQSSLGQHNDSGWEISGGTISGITGYAGYLANIWANNTYIHNVTFNGPANRGIVITNSDAPCVNSNVFAGSISTDIYYSASTNGHFNNNTTPHGTSPASLPTGTCP